MHIAQPRTYSLSPLYGILHCHARVNCSRPGSIPFMSNGMCLQKNRSIHRWPKFANNSICALSFHYRQEDIQLRVVSGRRFNAVIDHYSNRAIPANPRAVLLKRTTSKYIQGPACRDPILPAWIARTVAAEEECGWPNCHELNCVYCNIANAP